MTKKNTSTYFWIRLYFSIKNIISNDWWDGDDLSL